LTGPLAHARPKPVARRRLVERGFVALCLAGAAVAIAALLVLLAAVVVLGISRLDLSFLRGMPSRDPDAAGFHAAIVGSIWILVVCAATAVPLGVAAAVFLEEFRPRKRLARALHKIVETNIRNLAGVPSIVYGLIALTVFVRAFGLFGAANTYDQFDRYELADGVVVFGRTVENRGEAYRLETDLVGGVTLDRSQLPGLGQPPRAGETRILLGQVEFTEDYEIVFSTETVGRVTLDAWDLDAEPNDGVPFEPRRFEGRLTLLGRGERVVESPTRGRVVIDNQLIADPVADIDTVFVKAHRFRLEDGSTVSGQIVSMDHGAVAVRDPDGGVVEFNTAQVDRHTYSQRPQLGDEDSPLFIALPFGQTVLSGGLALMLVVLPIVIIAAQESLRAVPPALREGAFALGSTRWQMVRTTTLPAAIPGILTGVILALSRAIGEAAPILVVGGAVFINSTPASLMDGYAAMPLQIYAWTTLPDERFIHVAAAGIMVLLAVLLLFNAAAILIRRKLAKPLT
jgi:phosphate transport system permease protein